MVDTEGGFEVNTSKLEDLQDVSLARVEEAKVLVSEMATMSDANALYQRCFQLLKLGGLEAEIPRLVVFGQQSMGKTTLLGKKVKISRLVDTIQKVWGKITQVKIDIAQKEINSSD